MKAFYAIVILAAVASATAGPTIKNEPIDWYDCSGLPDGNYAHPFECTMFVSCLAGLYAWERDCAGCMNEPERCPYGRNVFDEAQGQCLWAEDTECRWRGSTPFPPPSSSSTAKPTDPTSASTTASPTTSSERPSSTSRRTTTTQAPTRSTSESTTTQAPTSSTSQAPGKPGPGDPCDPEDCENSGDCQSYLRCDAETSRLVEEQCGEDLFWNPFNADGSDQVHGGNCDLWENLNEDLQRRYRSDPDCLGCFWKQTGECERDYLYQPANQDRRNVLTLSCSEGLVFSQAKVTCQRCSDVMKSDGSACCE